MSDEDDWFERAIRDDDADERPDESEGGAEADEPEEDVETDDSDRHAETDEPEEDAADGSDGHVADDDAAEQDAGTDEPTDAGTGDADAPENDGDGVAAGDRPREDDESEENPFEQDFSEAFESAPSPESGGFPGGSEGEFDPEQGGFDEAAFDEESFESDLERLEIGIEGLDDMILGGVPRRSLMVAIGSAGTGKTTFGLQFLNHGLEQGEAAVYITLEESYDRILSTANEKGWDFEGYVDDDQLAIVDIDPVEMANSLDTIQNDLPGLIEDFGADRLVLDSVSLLEMMYERAPKRRSQVFGFTRALKRAGITTLLTSEANEENAYASRFGIVEYLADAVFVLQYVRGSDFRETRLAIEIQKIRDANHSRATKPYELTGTGISVYRQANIF